MPDKKIYSAFISSAFENLRDSRKEVIEALLDHKILPIGMEHFIVSSSGNFSDIEELIDDADFFVLLLGNRYGSLDEKEKISWTEKEYNYACQKKKHIIAIKCPEYLILERKPKEERTEDENRQVAFGGSVEFAAKAETNSGIAIIITRFLSNFNFSRCIGWTRIENISLNPEELQAWKESHKVYDISGVWHHVHLSDDDQSYMRIGTINITQDFAPNKYLDLQFRGENFGVLYSNGIIRPDRMRNSQFYGDYTMQENGEIFGIFRSRRSFGRGEFNGQQLAQGERRGIHDFFVDIYNDETTMICGEFHDEAPSPKQGRIFMFRTKEARDEFLLEQRKQILESI